MPITETLTNRTGVAGYVERTNIATGRRCSQAIRVAVGAVLKTCAIARREAFALIDCRSVSGVPIVEDAVDCYLICRLAKICLKPRLFSSILDSVMRHDADSSQDRDHNAHDQKFDHREPTSQSRTSKPPEFWLLQLTCCPDTAARGCELMSILRFTFRACHKSLMTMTQSGNRVNERIYVIVTTMRHDYCYAEQRHV